MLLRIVVDEYFQEIKPLGRTKNYVKANKLFAYIRIRFLRKWILRNFDISKETNYKIKGGHLTY